MDVYFCCQSINTFEGKLLTAYIKIIYFCRDMIFNFAVNGRVLSIRKMNLFLNQNDCNFITSGNPAKSLKRNILLCTKVRTFE